MFGIGKLFNPAARLAGHIEKAKEAEAKGDWKRAARHFDQAALTTSDADVGLSLKLALSAKKCRDRIWLAHTEARRKELGLS